jgi:hypothetical protein
MNALSSNHVTRSWPSPGCGVWRWCMSAVVVIALTACGGGGGEPASATFEPSTAALSAPRKKADFSPTLIGQPVAVVNSTTAGDQEFRAIGALAGGGYAVAYNSGTTLHIQRYDSAGNASGTVAFDPRDTRSQPLAARSIAVLRDGSVVVAYATFRSIEEPMSPIVYEHGLYMQRFDANGVQTLPETQLASIVGGDPRRPTSFELVQVLPMPDGSYVVAWGTFSTSATVGYRTSFHTQRFDAQNQPVGGAVNTGSTLNPTTYQIVADTNGGYTAYLSGMADDFSPTGLMVTHFDANDKATPILTGWPGTALLLPLEDGRYVLYTSDAGGVYRQILNSAGVPVGEKAALAVMPQSAQLLADGSYVVFWATTQDMTGQRFDPLGQPIGDLLTMQTAGAQPMTIPLAEPGLAAAWSAPSASSDLDVYTQRFIEMAGGQRKACLASARGLRGQARTAFMRDCLR